MRDVFICGTDTECGKTLVAGLLADHLGLATGGAVAQKWVQTGSSGPEDVHEHLKIAGLPFSHFEKIKDLVCPYVFRFPGSPHLSAKLEKKKIAINKIINSYRRLSKLFAHVVVEGSGGALVPLNENKLIIDLVRDLDLPVILVAENRLGAVNHALLTIEALKKRRIKLLGVIFNDCSGRSDKNVLKDNPLIVKKMTGINVLGTLPYLKEKAALRPVFRKIMAAI